MQLRFCSDVTLNLATRNLKNRSGGLLLPGAPRTALAYLLSSEAAISRKVVIGIYQLAHYGGTIPSTNCTFTTHVDPISPPSETHSLGAISAIRPRCAFGGGAGYRPRVRNAYFIQRLVPYLTEASTSIYRALSAIFQLLNWKNKDRTFRRIAIAEFRTRLLLHLLSSP